MDRVPESLKPADRRDESGGHQSQKQLIGNRAMSTHRVIAFATTDLESAPEIQAMDAADVDGLGREYRDSGLDVHLTDAQRRGEEIWVPIAGPGDLESVQHYFSAKVRWVSRGEMLASK